MNIKVQQQELIELLGKFVKVVEQFNLRYYLVGGSALGAIREQGFIPWDSDIDIAIPRTDFDLLVSCLLKNRNDEFFLFCDENGGEYHLCDAHKINSDGYDFNAVPRIDIFPIDGAPKSRVSQLVHLLKTDIAHIGVKMASIQECHIGDDRTKIKNLLIKVLQFLHAEKVANARRSQKKWDSISREFDFEKSEWAVVNYGVYGIREYIPKKWIGTGKLSIFENKEYRVYSECELYLKKIYGDDYMTPKLIVRR